MGVIERQLQRTSQDLILPRYDDLPRLGLYLEQVARYLNSTFAGVPGLQISSTTISSYVKRGIVARPVKRLYDRRQLAELIFVVAGRVVLSAADLHFLLQLRRRKHDLASAYNYFCAKLEEDYQYAFGYRPDLPEIGTEDSEEKRLLDRIVRAVVDQLYLQNYLSQAQENRNS